MSFYTENPDLCKLCIDLLLRFPALMRSPLLSLMVNTLPHKCAYGTRVFTKRRLLKERACFRFLFNLRHGTFTILVPIYMPTWSLGFVTKRNNRFSHNGFAEPWQPLNPWLNSLKQTLARMALWLS